MFREMDSGNFGHRVGYHTGAPIYFDQHNIVQQPVYQPYSHGPQSPVYFSPHPLALRTDTMYQQPPIPPGGPPPPQPVTGHAPRHSVPVYPYQQNVPSHTQVQPNPFSVAPPHRFGAPTNQSNVLFKQSPPPPSTPPIGAMQHHQAPPPLFAPVSPAISAGCNFSSRSSPPLGSTAVTSISPRLKVLFEQNLRYQTSAIGTSGHSSVNFLQAASQHGITVERPVTTISDSFPSFSTMTSVTPPVFPFTDTVLDSSKNENRSTVVDRQNLVDYYVNKHESLACLEAIDKETYGQTVTCIDKNNGNTEEILSKSNLNNNAEPCVNGHNKIVNIANCTNAFVNGEKNRNVLNWLSKADGSVTADDESCDVKENENVTDGTVDNLLELKNEITGEDIANVASTYFDDSVDICIEEHEFLSHNLEISAYSDESSTSNSGQTDSYDEVDGEINGKVVDTVLNSDMIEFVKDAVKENEEDEVKTDQKLGVVEERNTPEKNSQENSTSQVYDENVVNQYKLELQEAEKAELELLVTTNGFLEQVAKKIVKQAVAKGVLKFFDSLKDNSTNSMEKSVGDLPEDVDHKNECDSKYIEVFPHTSKGLYSWKSHNGTKNNETYEICPEIEQEERITAGTDGDISEEKSQPSDKHAEDFEKFFFKQTASKHGITIVSPLKVMSCQQPSKTDGEKEKCDIDTLHIVESQENLKQRLQCDKAISITSDKSVLPTLQQFPNIKKMSSQSSIKNLTEAFDSDLASVEGSQSDSGETFKMKASARGIIVQDPRHRASFSTDSDAELEQLTSQHQSRKASAHLDFHRSTSTPDSVSLNPESLEFQPACKKRTFSGGLRPDAAEFNPESLNSSFSMNTSVSESENSERLDSSMNVDALEFVPSSDLKPDAAVFEPKSKPRKKQDMVFKISTHGKKKSSSSVAVQASPTTSTSCVGTRRIKTKESSTVTGSCESRDVMVNTDENDVDKLDGSKVMVRRQTKLTNKASNTDSIKKRSVGINVRTRNPSKYPMCSVMTMTDLNTQESGKERSSGQIDGDLMERLRQQDVLLKSMGKLQIELMLFKEKEIKEKLCGMKEYLMQRMTGVMGLFTDGVEAMMLQSMIQSKLSMLEEALTEVKSVTKATIYKIQAGEILDQLPDFSNILPQMNKSPLQHFSSPKRRAASVTPGNSPELRASPSQSGGLKLSTSPFKGSPHNFPNQKLMSTSPVKFTGSTDMLGTCLHSMPNQNIEQQKEKAQVNIPGIRSRLSELQQNEESTSELKSVKSEASNSPVPAVKLTSSPAGKLSLTSTQEDIKFPAINIGSLCLNVSTDFGSQVDTQVSKLKSPTCVLTGQERNVNKDGAQIEQKCPSRLAFKKSPVTKVKDECKESTIAKSVKELDDLQMESTAHVNLLMQESKKKAPRTRGFMEIEDSSDDEEVDQAAVVIDKLDDEPEEVNKVDNKVETSPDGKEDLNEDVTEAKLDGVPKEDNNKVDGTEEPINKDINVEQKTEDSVVLDKLDDEPEEVKEVNYKVDNAVEASLDGKEDLNEDVTEAKLSGVPKEDTNNVDGTEESINKDINIEQKTEDFNEDVTGEETKVSQEYETQIVERATDLKVENGDNLLKGEEVESSAIEDIKECEGNENEDMPDDNTDKHEKEQEVEKDKLQLDESKNQSEEKAVCDKVDDKDEIPVLCDQIGNLDKLISEKMNAEYGKESEKTDEFLNDNVNKVVNDVSIESPVKLNNSLDAIDSDEDESVTKVKFVDSDHSERRPKCLEIDSRVDDFVMEEIIEAEPANADSNRTCDEKTGPGDHDRSLIQETTVTAEPVVPTFGSGFNINPKEVFMSPPKKVKSRVTSQQTGSSSNEIAVPSSLDLLASQPALVGQSLDGLSHMPMLMGNMDPILYQAVIAQLVQAYPELACNQEMLTQVAIQQTGLLQMYIGNPSANEQTVMGLGTGPPGIQDITGRPNVQTNITSISNLSPPAPGFFLNPLNSDSLDEGPASKRLRKDGKSSGPPGLDPIGDVTIETTETNIKSVHEKPLASDNSYPIESDKQHDSKGSKIETVDLADSRGKRSLFSETKLKSNKSSSGLDDFDLPPSYGTKHKSFNKNNNAISEVANPVVENGSHDVPDFMPDYAKRHKPENNSTRVIHHFEPKISDSVSRAIASSDQVHFERRSPIPKPMQVGSKMDDSNFPPLQSEKWQNCPTKFTDTSAFSPYSSGSMQSSSKAKSAQFSHPPNIPFRPRRQNKTGKQPYVNQSSHQYPPHGNQSSQQYLPQGNQSSQQYLPYGNQSSQQYPPHGNQSSLQYIPYGNQSSQQYPPRGNQSSEQYLPYGNQSSQQYPTRGNQSSQQYLPHGNQSSQQYPPLGNKSSQQYPPLGNQSSQQCNVTQQESWDDEVDNHATTFTLHHDVHKPVAMLTEKNQIADLTNPFLAPVSKDVPKSRSKTSMTDLCDIPLPRSAKNPVKMSADFPQGRSSSSTTDLCDIPLSKSAENPGKISADLPKSRSNSSVTDLCDIPLPKTAQKPVEMSVDVKSAGIFSAEKKAEEVVKKKEEEKVVEEWQEVHSKRKRHSSKEQKQLRQFSAPYVNTAPLEGAKVQKRNNFDRLIVRMQQEFPDANKQQVIDVIQKIRVDRGTLSGLSMETILEKAQSFIKPAKKTIPGLWLDKKLPEQKLNLPPRMQPANKPVSLLKLKLPPRKPASVGLLKLDVHPRQKPGRSDLCTNTFDEDICVICHDPLSTEPVKELDCMHVFHSQCISQWVERERTCPTCRKHALFPEEFPRLGK